MDVIMEYVLIQDLAKLLFVDILIAIMLLNDLYFRYTYLIVQILIDHNKTIDINV